MHQPRLTDRQRREVEYYETFSRLSGPGEVSFAPVEGKEQRPWNSYWVFYERARRRFTSPGQRLLDFGCGTGLSALRFARVGYEVHGFDLSPANIALAKEQAGKFGLAGRCHFSVQAAEDLDYPSASFDIVAGRDILHHVEIEPAVRQCLRVLKPGGMAIFREWIEAPVFDTLRRTIGAWLVPPGKSLERHVTEDERKLTDEDIARIRRLCPQLTVERYMLVARIGRLLPPPVNSRPSLLEKVDWGLFQMVPWLRGLGGSALVTLQKE